MMIPGYMKHDRKRKTHAAIVKALSLGDFGRTRPAAQRGLKELIELTAGDYGIELTVEIVGAGEDTFFVTSPEPAKLVALVLRQQREIRRMSLADVANAIGAKSRNEWGQYERGKHMPSAVKLQRMLDAIGCELAVAIVPRHPRVVAA